MEIFFVFNFYRIFCVCVSKDKENVPRRTRNGDRSRARLFVMAAGTAVAASLALFSLHVVFTFVHSYIYNNAFSHVNAVVDWILFIVLLVVLADNAASSSACEKDDR